MYFSAASARINNHPAYVEAVLGKEKYVIPGDKKRLHVVTLQPFTPEGMFKGNLKAITGPDPGVQEFQEKFKERIKGKMLKYPSFRYHLDLVVHDQEGYLMKDEKIHGGEFFFTNEELCFLLINTHFQEVFYLGQYHAQAIYLPLRTTLFLYHVALFHFFYWNELMTTYPSSKEHLLLLLCMLACLGYEDLQLLRTQNEEVFVYQNKTMVNLTNHANPLLLTYQKQPFPAGEPLLLLREHFEKYRPLFADFLSFKQSHIIPTDHFVFPSALEGKEKYYR